jgi:N6-adenosine-specific RNA methylase IME4
MESGGIRMIKENDSGKFDLALIDPPWPQAKRNKNTKFGLGANSYDLMSLDEICGIKVGSIMKDNSMIAMWTTGPYLEKGFKAINAWGFTHCTICFAWVKLNRKNKKALEFLKNKDFKYVDEDDINTLLIQILEMISFKGPGNYTKANMEFCLLAKRGKGLSEGRGGDGLNKTVRSRKVRQIIFSPIISPHSRKPDEARKRLKDLFGEDRKMIEFFARENVDGWTSIGNQITGNDINVDVENLINEIGEKHASIQL